MIRVVCADDYDIAREGMVRILERQPYIECVAAVGEPLSVPVAVVEQKAHVLLLDLEWYGDFKVGLDLILEVKQLAPQAKILAITVHGQLAPHAVTEAADAVVDKGIRSKRLVQKIRELVQEPPEIVKARQHLVELQAITPGKQEAFRAHEDCVLKLLRLLLKPDLMRWHSQVRNVEGTQIVDIIASNHATVGFWRDVRERHDAQQIVFELKNVGKLGNRHIDQVASQLGEPRGKLGFLVGRHPPSAHRELAAEVPYRRDRKVVLLLCDQDLEAMVNLKVEDKEPVEKIQDLYDGLMNSL